MDWPGRAFQRGRRGTPPTDNSTALSGSTMLCCTVISLEVVPIRGTQHPAPSSQGCHRRARPASHPKPLDEGNSGTARAPPFLPFQYAHPPAVSPFAPPLQPSSVSSTHSLVFPSATPAYSPDAFACPLQGNWSPRIQRSTVRIVVAVCLPLFLDPIDYSVHCVCVCVCVHTQICSNPLHTSSARPSLHTASSQQSCVTRAPQNYIEPRPEHDGPTAQQDGSLTAGSRLGIHPPVRRYGSLWP